MGYAALGVAGEGMRTIDMVYDADPHYGPQHSIATESAKDGIEKLLEPGARTTRTAPGPQHELRLYPVLLSVSRGPWAMAAPSRHCRRELSSLQVLRWRVQAGERRILLSFPSWFLPKRPQANGFSVSRGV